MNDTKQYNDIMIHVLRMNDVLQERKWLNYQNFFVNLIPCTVNIDWI